MSMQQETRFACDHCGATINVPHNEQPALERGKPPGGWVAVYIHSPQGAPLHVCPKCAPRFEEFIKPDR